MTDVSHLATCIVFTDYSKPEVAKKTSALLKLIEEFKPDFETQIKFVWTDSKYYLEVRNNLGIHWDELPAIGVKSRYRDNLKYPKDGSFDKSSLVKWFKEITTPGASATTMEAGA